MPEPLTLILIGIALIITSVCDDLMETFRDHKRNNIFEGEAKWRQWMTRGSESRYDYTTVTVAEDMFNRQLGIVIKTDGGDEYTIHRIHSPREVIAKRSKIFFGIPAAGGHWLSGIIQTFWDGWHFFKALKLTTYAAIIMYLAFPIIGWYSVAGVALYLIIQGSIHYLLYGWLFQS